MNRYGRRYNARHLKKLLVDNLQGIHPLLQLDVLIGELSAVIGLTKLLLDHLLSARSKGREARAVR